MALLLIEILNGVQLGVLLFLIAAGLTLVFGVMNFINLAHGVQYMLGAYFAVTFYAFTGSFFSALILALGATLALGLLLEFLIYRHLYARNHLEQVIATFGIILFLNGMAQLVWGAAPLTLPIPPMLTGSIHLIDGLAYPVWRISIIASGLIIGVALYLVVGTTRIGMLVRAGANNAPMVSALGVNIYRLFMIVFGAGSMLAGFAGIMIAPIISVQPGMGDTVLIFAFVVIVIGGIGSIRGAFIAALMIGVIDTLGRSFSVDLLRLVMGPSQARTVGPAIASMLIYLLMAAVLYFRPNGLFPTTERRDIAPTHNEHGTPAEVAHWHSLPALALPGMIFAVLVALPLLPLGLNESFVLSFVTRAMVFSVAAIGLDLLLGYGGLISFGFAAFVGIGAYTTGILTSSGTSDALVLLPASMGAGGLFAYVTGLVSLRVRGVYFIMITLAFSQMAFFTASSLADYGGDDGFSLLGRSTVFGAELINDTVPFYYFVLLCLLASFVFCRLLVASRFGRVLRGAKDNVNRMHAIAFDVFHFRLCGYVIAGALGGLAGFLLANAAEFVSPSYMSWQRSGELIIMVVLGGIGTLTGPILGVFLYLLGEEWFSALTEHWTVIFGPSLVALSLLFPAGIRGALASIARRLRHD